METDYSFVDSIISSEVVDGRAQIKLLSNLPKEFSEGSLTQVCLKGNILADVEWSNGKFKNAKLWTEQGTTFIKELTVIYDGKKYETQLSDGSLDIRNVLPATV